MDNGESKAGTPPKPVLGCRWVRELGGGLRFALDAPISAVAFSHWRCNIG